MDSLQFGNSRMVHDTTTCSWPPYNIMIRAQQFARLRHGLRSINAARWQDSPDRIL